MGDVISAVEKTWVVNRTGRISEVLLSNGAIRFHVEIWDEGRKPFLVRWFNDVVAASDFLEKVIGGNYATHDR